MKKFKSIKWPVKKRKTSKRALIEFATPWGYISELGSNWTFSKISFQIVLLIIVGFFVYHL